MDTTNYRPSSMEETIFTTTKEMKNCNEVRSLEQNKYSYQFEGDHHSDDFVNSNSHRNRLTSGDYESNSSKISENIRTNNLHSILSFDRQLQEQYKMLQ